MLLTFLGRTHVGDYGWPAGGSIALARALERRFLKLGGEIRYEARVQSIIVENERAVGVRLSDGTEQRADIVAGFDFPVLVLLARTPVALSPTTSVSRYLTKAGGC